VPPNQLLTWLSQGNDFPKQLESFFNNQKVKDDVTVVSVPVEVAPFRDVLIELQEVRKLVEGLQKEQSAFRNDLGRISVPAGSIEKISKQIQELTRQVDSLTREHQALKNRGTAGSATAQERKPLPKGPTPVAPAPKNEASLLKNPWLWGILVIAIVATAAATRYLSYDNHSSTSVERITPRHSRTTTPPAPVASLKESSDNGTCLYTVAKGDTLQGIAGKSKITLDALIELNPGLQKKSSLRIGQTLKLCPEREQP